MTEGYIKRLGMKSIPIYPAIPCIGKMYGDIVGVVKDIKGDHNSYTFHNDNGNSLFKLYGTTEEVVDQLRRMAMAVKELR